MRRQLRLNTLSNARKSLAGILRAYHRDEIATEKARTEAYLFAKYLEIWKTEKEVEEFETRLAELEVWRYEGKN